MSAAIAMPPSPAPHDRRTYTDRAPPTATATPRPNSTSASAAPSATPSQPNNAANAAATSTTKSSSKSPARAAHQQTTKSSPPSASRNVPGPKIVVKKEPGSPGIQPATARHRPRKLDLSKGHGAGSGAATARPAFGARDSLGIREVGIACLSPGFVTQDPNMQASLAQSLDVREQQRRIIDARLQQQNGKGDTPSNKDRDASGSFVARTPGMSRRNKAPPGLNITAPSHDQFANERVIQSAPLGQTFTGRHNAYPGSQHQPSNLSSTSHIHHAPAQQTANRLPPISDVFGQGMNAHQQENNARQLNPGTGHPPLPSPGHPPPQAHSQAPLSARPREYRSAEEAQQELAGGRADLLPKIVHYTGLQPPTPPSPRNGMSGDGGRGNSKRRTRAEYEEGGSPPLGHGPSAQRPGPFGAGRDSPETQRQKKEEFMRLASRAWDLFHS